MLIPETEFKQGEAAPDIYRFWGCIQRSGVVTPSNIDYEIYYIQEAVETAPSVVGAPVRVDHTDIADIGEVIDEAILEDNLFGLFEITRQGWERFLEALEDHNGNKPLDYDSLVEQIDDGKLALSAGLSAATAETPIHKNTVYQIDGWKEVSIVSLPAVKGSWAWACEGECSVVFGEQNMTQELDVDLKTLRQEAGSEPTQVLEVLEVEDSAGVQILADGTATVYEDESELPEQSSCTCGETDEELEQIKQERDTYKEALDEIQQKQREKAEERLRDINQELPEEERHSEEELDQMVDGADVSRLNQMADMMEKLVDNSSSTNLQSNKEDLNGTGGSNEPDATEEAQQKVDEVCQNMFDRPADQVFEDIEEGRFGE
ncbi:MAG: hypothetical protein ABEH81_01020 [Halopenitus sp.]